MLPADQVEAFKRLINKVERVSGIGECPRRDGWSVGLTILTALANLLPVLPEEEAYLALFHGARRVAAHYPEPMDPVLMCGVSPTVAAALFLICVVPNLPSPMPYSGRPGPARPWLSRGRCHVRGHLQAADASARRDPRVQTWSPPRPRSASGTSAQQHQVQPDYVIVNVNTDQLVGAGATTDRRMHFPKRVQASAALRLTNEGGESASRTMIWPLPDDFDHLLKRPILTTPGLK
jgi:hypothetical protein